MRIAWFTPLGRQSAIGNFSATVCRQLACRHDVTLYASDVIDRASSRPVDLPVVWLKTASVSCVTDQLRAAGAVFYNMGDHLAHHKLVYEWLARHSGIVILHDLVLRGFFVGYYHTEGRLDRLAFLDLVKSCHGEPGREWVRKWQEGEIATWSDEPGLRAYHMAGAVTRLARGVAVHSRYAERRVKGWGRPPVIKVAFPTPALPPPAAQARIELGDTSARLSALSFGCINPNKMVDAVIEAIGTSRYVRSRLFYTIAGRVLDSTYHERLKALIDRFELQGVVELLGPVSDDELHRRLQRADLVVNLRNPHLGESSWSLAESLLAGKPTIVWDRGYYGEFPAEVVQKVDSRAALSAALEKLCREPERRRLLAFAARGFALANFRTDRYCEAIVRFAESLRRPSLGRRLLRTLGLAG
jgi:glycosyltransferase involved in cell wall biosynthesis